MTSSARRDGISVWRLRAIVVVAGMTTMATEMAASRLLAPFFGASVMVWANIIGLILIYLSVGYWYGGRLADRYPTMRGLCTVTAAAAVLIAAVPYVAQPILHVTSGGIDTVAPSAVIGSFAGCLLIFSVPITLLGMVPPYTVRLALNSVDTSGQVAGSLYALSTIGSILGTFGSVLVLIPWIGTRDTMLVFAMLLALLSVVGLSGRRRVYTAGAIGVMVIGMLMPAGVVKRAEAGSVVFEEESPYQFVQVVRERGTSRMLLQLNEGWAVHSIYDPATVLTGGVWDDFLVVPSLAGRAKPSGPDSDRSMRMLIIGNAAGTAAREFGVYRPHVHIDGVELDPVVTHAGRRFFRMGDAERTNLTVHAGDGRPFLRHAGSRRWDVIHIDAYRQPYIPFYLTTREFFQSVRSHLTPGGVVSINVGSSPHDDRINRAVAATMRDVFPTVVRWRAQAYNEVIMAMSDPMTSAQFRDHLMSSDLAANPNLADMFSACAANARRVRPNPSQVLTDDHAPVEWMTDRMILREAS